MAKFNYKEYLSSKDWLLKKNELISIYLSQGWNINCIACSSEHNLQVHHMNYDEIGKENLSEKNSKKGKGVWQLQFLCNNCHKKWHFEKGFKDTVLKKEDQLLSNFWIKEGILI